ARIKKPAIVHQDVTLGLREGIPEEEQQDWCHQMTAEFIEEDIVPYSETPCSYLKCVKERFAFPRIKNEDPDDNRPGEKTQFSTLEEAEALMERRFANSWIVHNKVGNCDEKVARHILEYAAAEPPPVFFVEPGDLILKTEWIDSSICILRKRKK
ncbi:MAG: hypothetical protein SGILL_010717, partial [Bacillariaceae sp.]